MTTTSVSKYLSELVRGEREAVCIFPDGRTDPHAAKPSLIVAGSFNPVHDGHFGIADAAGRLTGGQAVFELSVANPDKPPLEDSEVHRRAVQFAWRYPIWLTRAATFVEKSHFFRAAVFVVGADTAERIVLPRYYGGEQPMHAALSQIRNNGCRFLVAGRADDSGRFVDLCQLPIPDTCRDLFAEIPAGGFRVDISSTAMRARMFRSP